jgi:hypothetical protein
MSSTASWLFQKSLIMTRLLITGILYLIDEKMLPNEYEKDTVKTIVSKINSDNCTFNDANTAIECGICLLTMASSHSIVPCGHTFCYECIDNCAANLLAADDCKCPFCRGKFKIADVIPSRSTDAIIEEVLLRCIMESFFLLCHKCN